jgi:hypothetical protein
MLAGMDTFEMGLEGGWKGGGVDMAGGGAEVVDIPTSFGRFPRAMPIWAQ